MQFFIVNTTGAVTEIKDTQENCDKLLKRGWKLATPEQVAAYKAKYRRFNADPIPDSTQSLISFKSGLLDVYYLTPDQSPDGYGMVSGLLQRQLMQLGVYLNREYHGQQVGLCYHYPYHLAKLKTQKRILYTMFESTKMPSDWGDYLKLADVIIVPSQFCADVMERQFGVRPLVIPHGYDSDVFKFMPRVRPAGSPVTFLHYDAFKWRKGWDIVHRAFLQAFGDDQKAQLILKTTNPKSLPFDYPNIKVLRGPVPHYQLAELLGSADCFVYPSRGEGYGLPPLEALATGMRVIAPNAHGISQYFDESYIDSVETKPVRARYENQQFAAMDLGDYAETTIDSLAEAMKQCYVELSATMIDRSSKNRATFATSHAAKVFAPYFANVIKETAAAIKAYTKPETPQLSVIVLTHNAIEYSKKCLAAINRFTRTSYEVIVIDNNSTDGTIDWLQQLNRQYPQMQLTIQLNASNAGVAGGRNQGIALARGHYVVFLDNDTEVQVGWDQRILDTLTLNGDVWVVGKAGNLVPSTNPLIFNSTNGDERAEADVVAGFCCAFPRKVIKYIGNQYDGLGKFWHEDLEFCLRVKKYGKRVIRDAGIPIIHHGHKSAGDNCTTDDQIKAHYDGFDLKAKLVGQRLIDSNTITIYREIDKEHSKHSSYSVIANHLTEPLRQAGFVVFRKPHLHSPTMSFDLCKGFEMHYQGKRFVIMHLENDRPPNSWLKELELVDGVFCSSDHTYFGLLSAGVDAGKLINITPDGFDATTYHWEVQPLDVLPYGKPDAFTFIQVGAAQPRKGTDILIKAFATEFKRDEPAQLLIKNYDYGQDKWVRQLISSAEHPNIVTVYDDWGSDYLARVLKTISTNGAYCSPHRGEGFGIPQLEAVACGMRIGYTQWGGPLMTLNNVATAIPFDCKLVPSTFHNNLFERYYQSDEQPMWAEPSVEAVRQWMRAVYESAYNKKLSKIVSREVVSRWSFEKRAQELVKYFKSISNYVN